LPNSFALGSLTWPRLRLVAHFGTSPVSVNCAVILRATSAAFSPSSTSQVPAGYAAGSAVSNDGLRFEFGLAVFQRQ
jgi:hypothetical protein